METPYIMFNEDDLKAIVVSLSPTMDLTESHAKLEQRSEIIRNLPIAHPERQLLAALRSRAQYLSAPSLATHKDKDDLTLWLRLQRSSPLAA